VFQAARDSQGLGKVAYSGSDLRGSGC
jgi:hypothetical protein